VYAETKYQALDKCDNREDCGCVMDRDCNNAKNGFVLCAKGCEDSLLYSDHTCTLTPKSECTCDHPNGGPLSTGISCDGGMTGSCGGGQMCTKGSVKQTEYCNGNDCQFDKSPLCMPVLDEDTPAVPIELTCFEDGIHYSAAGSTYLKLYDIKTAADCKAKCVADARCEYYSWRNKEYLEWGVPAFACMLKDSKGAFETEMAASVSGPKYCEKEKETMRRLDEEKLTRRLLGEGQ